MHHSASILLQCVALLVAQHESTALRDDGYSSQHESTALMDDGYSSADEGRQSPRHDNPCDGVSYRQCRDKPGCMWADRGCAVRIAWLHVMKTGSSLGTTLAHHANSSLPTTAHIPSGRDQSDPEDRLESPRFAGNLNLDFFAVKYPINEWFPDVFRKPGNPAVHWPIQKQEYEMWKGYWVGLFRQPAYRVHSSWHYFTRGKGSLMSFARNVAGQQAGMLSGGLKAMPRMKCELKGGGQRFHDPQCDVAQEVAPDVPLAIQRLAEGFAFVGILEEYDLAICLFHTIFGSECRAVEFLDVRPTVYNEDKYANKTDVARLEMQGDPWDTPVYEFAKRRFWTDVLKYNVSRRSCRSMCPGVDAFRDDDDYDYDYDKDEYA
eukprot:TRINITY_DN55118_c0_g1_i1.p1 TRINITY_DN55118_c0_g1~~TRINITY_DN55118_c0_g1_i1.p1  ORF type:complete len:377 (-),score=24.57 TRINITY_DN55118_c0_g1_i1:66-1196(-)